MNPFFLTQAYLTRYAQGKLQDHSPYLCYYALRECSLRMWVGLQGRRWSKPISNSTLGYGMSTGAPPCACSSLQGGYSKSFRPFDALLVLPLELKDVL